MCQAETVIACAPVISRYVDALVYTAAIVFCRTLIDICNEKHKQDCEDGCLNKLLQQKQDSE